MQPTDVQGIIDTANAECLGVRARIEPPFISRVDGSYGSRLTSLAVFESKARALRKQFVADSFSSGAGWDILVELFVAECVGRRLSISDVGRRSEIPGTTVLRWISALEQHGLVGRTSDLRDARCSRLGLTEPGTTAMQGYFSSVGEFLPYVDPFSN